VDAVDVLPVGTSDCKGINEQPLTPLKQAGMGNREWNEEGKGRGIWA